MVFSTTEIVGLLCLTVNDTVRQLTDQLLA